MRLKAIGNSQAIAEIRDPQFQTTTTLLPAPYSARLSEQVEAQLHVLLDWARTALPVPRRTSTVATLPQELDVGHVDIVVLAGLPALG